MRREAFERMAPERNEMLERIRALENEGLPSLLVRIRSEDSPREESQIELITLAIKNLVERGAVLDEAAIHDIEELIADGNTDLRAKSYCIIALGRHARNNKAFGEKLAGFLMKLLNSQNATDTEKQAAMNAFLESGNIPTEFATWVNDAAKGRWRERLTGRPEPLTAHARDIQKRLARNVYERPGL